MTKHEREFWRADSGAYAPARILQSALSDIDERDRVLTKVLDASANLVDYLDTTKRGCGEALSQWSSAVAEAEKLLEGTNGTASDQ